MNILVTGGTGFLGKELLKHLVPKAEKIYLLCRNPTRRIEKLYEEFENVILVKGDISSPDIIEDASILKEVREKIDTLLHGAAYYDLEGPYSSCFMYNVVGTQNIIYLAAQCKNLKSFHYISTIAVAGDFVGLFKESDFDSGQKFTNHYSKTKFDAEAMVRAFDFKGKINIYRLGILIGHSETGAMPKVDGPYYFFKFLAKFKDKKDKLNLLKVLPFPYSETSKMPFVPVDCAARTIVRGLDQEPEQDLNCYHVVSKRNPSIKTFVEDSLKMFGYKLNLFALPYHKSYKFLLPKIGLPSELLLYMFSKCDYDTCEIERDFPDSEIKGYPEYSSKFYDYARGMFE